MHQLLNELNKIYQKLPRFLQFVVSEMWPILILLFAFVVELAHIENSSWLQFFLYYADSLTFPLVRESIAHKEPFLWVFSSQFGLFPEGLFYTVSSFFTHSVNASLVFNATLNITSFYVLIRWAAGSFSKVSKHLHRVFALGCSLLLILYMVLERQAYVNSRSIATLYLLTTYYYGMVISSAFLLCLTLVQFNNLGSLKQSKKWLLVAIGFLVAALTAFSDPLFLVAYILPFLVVLVLVVIYGGLKVKQALQIGLPQLLGAAIGYKLILHFKDFVGQTLGAHVSTQQIPATLTVFHSSLSIAIHSKTGRLELVLIFAVILFSLIYSIWWVYVKTHDNTRKLDSKLLMLCLFSITEPIFIIGFSIAIGSTVTRYLLPMIILPLFGLLPIMVSKLTQQLVDRFKNVLIGFAAAVAVIILVVGSLSWASATKLLSSTPYSDSACLANTLHHQEAYGAGEYWTVRPLDVYDQPDEQAVQVNSSFSIYPWQYNVGAYNHTYSFVIVDTQPSLQGITASDPYLPAGPSKITSCGNMYIYQYAVNSPGYLQLNSDIHTSYEYVKQLRSEGKVAKYLAACTFIIPGNKISPLCKT
ncbi:MAG TPA: hypothetical protein VMR28_02470 [Candidatus Saccharimonadales bacterium]|nr:hypothetical protein [Candidatus Saccharimonadales bacterium]